MITHTGPLRVLVLIEPESSATDLAVKYFLNNKSDFYDELDSLAVGILALSELDYEKYEEEIKDIGNYIKKKQRKEGYWSGGGDVLDIELTSLIVIALLRVFKSNDESIIKAIKWLKEHQDKNGSWKNHINATAYACLALMYVEEKPKISLGEFELLEMITKQKLASSKPYFIYTSPTSGVTEIKEKIHEMLDHAKKRVWICSRFITDFWTDIINLKKEKTDIDIKVITIPRSEAKDKYIGEGKKFVTVAFEALQKSLGGNLRCNSILHARLYIVDDEILVSSVDITSEQLEKQFNVGIWTRENEAVKRAIDFFESLWKESEEIELARE